MYADDQVAELMRMPNIPTDVVEAAKQFPQHVQNLEKSKAQGLLTKWRTADRAKLTETSEQVSNDHKRLEELTTLVERGARTSASVMEEVAKIERRLKEAQRRRNALENSEARYAAVEADPCAYFDDFYNKYAGLRDRRMNLRDYLAERGLSR
jgi:DNA repair ATPase RecN